MSEQLQTKNTNETEWYNAYPVTTLDAVKDLVHNKTLKEILNSYNHIYLPLKNNSKRETRLQIPVLMRRKGLWITYKCRNGHLITEYYVGEDARNDSFGDSKNWIHYIDNQKTREIVNEKFGWYILN